MTWHGNEEVPFQSIGMNTDKWGLLKELAEDNDYWRGALHFVESMRNRGLPFLSDKQKNWLYDIDATLGVELDKRTAKEVFRDER